MSVGSMEEWGRPPFHGNVNEIHYDFRFRAVSIPFLFPLPFIEFCKCLLSNVEKTRKSIENRLIYLSNKDIGQAWIAFYNSQYTSIDRLLRLVSDSVTQAANKEECIELLKSISFYNLRNIETKAASAIFVRRTRDSYRLLYDKRDGSLFHDKKPKEISEARPDFYYDDLQAIDIRTPQVMVDLDSECPCFGVVSFACFSEYLPNSMDDLITKICSSIVRVPVSKQVELMKHYLEAVKQKSIA